MKEKYLIKMKCNKCGKYQEPDKKQSNQNWNIFLNIPCKCSGKFEFTLIDKKGNNGNKI